MDPELIRSIGRLEGKVDEMKGFMEKVITKHEERLDHLDKRVGSLKNKWAFAAGISAVITFMVAHVDILSAITGLLPK